MKKILRSAGLAVLLGSCVQAAEPAAWMEGQVGIGWRFDAANDSEIAGWNVNTLVNQVKTIPNVKYVLFNLSDAAYGDTYVAPHSVLTAITPDATPDNDRDLFLEMATAFKGEGYKVIAYIACQGPAMLKHGVNQAFDKKLVNGVWTSQAMTNWENYVNSVYGNTTDETYKKAFAEIIVDEYAERYGTLIDGWWFDNGSEAMNAPLLHTVVTAHNPNVICTFNGSDQNQDYLTGHPRTDVPFSDDANLTKLLFPIEKSYANGDGGYIAAGNTMALGHMFMPAHENWNGGDIIWTVDKAADWVNRCSTAGGAWTWNVDTSAGQSLLRADTVELMQDVYEKIAENETNNAPNFAMDMIDGGEVDFGSAYTNSVAGLVTDAEGDTLSFYKIDGPGWLVVSTNGTLSGTPADTMDLGMNRFTILVGDGKGHVDTAEMEIIVHHDAVGDRSYYSVEFDDFRGDLSWGLIDGLQHTDSNTSLSKVLDGNDYVFSFSIINQNFDGDADADESLSWKMRVKGYSGGSYVLNGNDSSVILGANVLVDTAYDEFGPLNRYLDKKESIQFSVEDIVLTGADGAEAEFAGFDGVWGTAGTYVLGMGSGLDMMTLSANGNVTLPSPNVLTITSSSNSERIKNLDGVFRVYRNNDPYFLVEEVELDAATGVAFSGSLANLGALAIDPDNDTLTYSRVSGSPTWLKVSANGTLSGTPYIGNVGVNYFTITVTDEHGGTDEFVLRINMRGQTAHWALDQGSGTTAVDSSGCGADATITDGAWVAGVDGGALDFNGSSSTVTLPPSVFSSISDQITVAMWVYGDTTQPRSDSVFSAEDADGNRLMNINLPYSNSRIYWDAGNVGATYDRISKLASTGDFMGQWNHWVFTKDTVSGIMSIYLNGTLWHSETGKTKSLAGVAVASLGSRISGFSYDGMIDDVRLYNVALDASEVAGLYEAVNFPPLANDLAKTVNEDGSVGITLTGSDANGDSLTYALVTSPVHGTLSGTAPELTYTPTANYNGLDSFTYKVNDGAVDSDVASVSMTVSAVNDAPTFNMDPMVGANGMQNSAYSGSLSASDIEGDSLSYSVVSGPAWLTVASDGSLSGMPMSGDVGDNSWTVAVSDGNGGSHQAVLLITVNAHPNPGIKVTEVYLTSGDFTGTNVTIALDHDLESDYFILVRGSRDGNGGALPDNDYVRVTGVPWGKGDMAGSGGRKNIILTRPVADEDWEGVVTVVECADLDSPAGFKLVDIVSSSMSGLSGTDSSAAWSDVNQVVLFGGYRGGGVNILGNTTGRGQGTSAYTRLYPSGTGTLNWTRDAAGETLNDAVMTSFVVEWGSEWTVQHTNVSGSNGGDGADATNEYTTATISTVVRANTWVWGTGTRADAGIGDCAESCLVTLGNGVAQNSSESTVAVGSEYTDVYDFDVYTMTHPDLSVDHRFKPDGDTSASDLAVSVDDAVVGGRFGWCYNAVNGTGYMFPRPRMWARYTDDGTITISRGYNGSDFSAWVQGIDLSGLNE